MKVIGVLVTLICAVLSSPVCAQLYSVTDLGDLGGGLSAADGINDLGQVVGYSTDGGGNTLPFLWTSGGGMQSLGSFGGTIGYATGINNSGQIVGYSVNGSGVQRAYISNNGGPLTDLGDPTGGDIGTLAFGINNSNQVSVQAAGSVGSGYHWQAGTFSAGTNVLFMRDIN